MNKKVAFKEAVADTFLAFIINFPLNLLLIAIAFDLDFTALQIYFSTLVFTNPSNYKENIHKNVL